MSASEGWAKRSKGCRPSVRGSAGGKERRRAERSELEEPAVPCDVRGSGAEARGPGEGRHRSLTVFCLPRQRPRAPLGGRWNLRDSGGPAFQYADPAGEQDVAGQRVARRRHGVRGALRMLRLALRSIKVFRMVKVPDVRGGDPSQRWQDRPRNTRNIEEASIKRHWKTERKKIPRLFLDTSARRLR